VTEQQTTGPPTEVELKYRVTDAAAGDRYLVADEIGGFRPTTPVRSTQLEDRYVDTGDGALARAGFAARLRQSAVETIVSVKSTTRRRAKSGAHRREELEGPADRTAPPSDWPASAARSLILEHCGDAPLVELVTIRQLRRKRLLDSGDAVVELSLDEVDAVSRSRVVERFTELEVELVSGDEAALAAIDAVLSVDSALAPSAGSKLESALIAVRAGSPKRGRRTADTPVPTRQIGHLEATTAGEADAAQEPTTEQNSQGGNPAPQPPAVVAAPAADSQPSTSASPGPGRDRPQLTVSKAPGVLAGDHIAEAGRKVLRFHLARMLARESGTRAGTIPEELHAMRVATRRQRAAWRVFGDAFRPRRTKIHRARLRDVAARLGAVRDLDVLFEAADAYRAALSAADQRALDPLLKGWRAHRADARRLLLRELDSDRYRRWIDEYSEFVRHEGLAVIPVGPTAPHHVRDTASSRIMAAYEGVRAYEPVLRWADVETLHDLRIAAKWLRYTIEFVREPLGPDASPLIDRVTALQDHLGELNDADVTAHMARSFLVENASSLSGPERAAIGGYLESREADVARLRRTVGGPWRGVTGVGFRRDLGKTLAGL
jgi:CHAD domain-containing protein